MNTKNKSGQPITILIPEIKGNGWLGGELYFQNLERAVNGRNEAIAFAKYDPAFRVKVSDSLGTKLGRKLSGKSIISELDAKAENYFASVVKHGTPVIFSNAVVPHHGKIPYIFWIPDFQFLHLPDFASKEHIEACKRQVRQGAASATLIMLSSNDALRDLQTFLPEFASKGRVVSFAKSVDDKFRRSDPSYVIGKYSLPEKYFYVPNQFWKHKNHLLILKAIAVLKKKGVEIPVVFSGNINDFRNPDHFNGILTFIATNDLNSNVHLLGMIPYEDVIALIRSSHAVINSSLFEGWSTTVEEVKSLGKKMLLSDLDVHREQAPDDAVYFNRYNENELAQAMEKMWMLPLESEQPGLAIEHSLKRFEKFGDAFISLINEAMQLKVTN